MSDEITKPIPNQSLHETVLQVLNTPTGETMTPQMLLGLIGLLDLASILDYLHANGPSPTPPVTLNTVHDTTLQRSEQPAALPSANTGVNNAALMNTLMSLVSGKNGGKINPSLLPLLLNMLSTKPAEPNTSTKQEEESKE
jgi:hypothetical protein